jgi:HK97 family phage major capsid protein
MDPETLRKLMLNQLEHRQLVATRVKTYDAETHSIEAVATTETPVQVIDWERWEMIDEVILGSGIELPERGQVPMLDSHNRWSVNTILGSGREWKPGSPETTCRLYFSSTADKAETLVREGHLTDVSIGYRCLESTWIPAGQNQKIDGRDFKGPIKVSTRTMIKEISPTPIGADGNATMREIDPQLSGYLAARGLSPSASFEEMSAFMKRDAHNTNEGKGNLMTPEEIAAQKKAEEERKAAEAKALDELRAQAAKETQDRIESICTTADKFRNEVPDMDKVKADALKEKWSSERFYREVLNRMGQPKAANTPAPDAPTFRMRDVIKPWQRRTVHLLHSKVLQANGNEDAARKWKTMYDDETRAMTQLQRDAEDGEALDKIMKSGLSEEQQVRLMSTISGTSTGFYLVPTPLLAEVFILVEKWGAARRHFRSIPMTSDTLKLDSLVTEATAYWITTQGSNITSSDIVFGQGTLTVLKLAGISAWTSEVDEESAVAYLPIFTASLARAIYKKEDLAGFIGDGTSTYGSFTGMLAASTNVVTMDSGKVAFTDATADDYKALRDAVNIDFRDGAMYFLSPAQVSDLEGMKDQQLRYVYREPAAGMPATLWGFPIADSVGINALTKTSAAATRFAAFGNPKFMLMGVRRQLDMTISREGILDNGTDVLFNALQADGAIVRMTERIGFKAILTTGFSVLKTATT